MSTANSFLRTASTLAGLAVVCFSTAAMAQNAAPPAYPDPNAPLPAYPAPSAPPPGYPDPNAAPPPGAYSDAPPPTVYLPPPPIEQHTGLYLHVHAGGGFTSVSGKDGGGNKTTMSGGGFSFGAAIGAAVAPNFVLFVDAFLSGATNASVMMNGVDFGMGSSTASLDGFGGGAAYYFEPVNLYIAGALALTRFEIDDSDGNSLYQSDAGFGLHFMVGKEWWVTRKWGLGVAAELIAASMKDAIDPTTTWNGGAFNLLFSATFN